jgi:hypothetical protein
VSEVHFGSWISAFQGEAMDGRPRFKKKKKEKSLLLLLLLLYYHHSFLI